MGKITLPQAVMPLVEKGAEVAYIPPPDASSAFVYQEYEEVQMVDAPGLQPSDLKVGNLRLAAKAGSLQKAKDAIAREKQAAKAAKVK